MTKGEERRGEGFEKMKKEEEEVGVEEEEEEAEEAEAEGRGKERATARKKRWPTMTTYKFIFGGREIYLK